MYTRIQTHMYVAEFFHLSIHPARCFALYNPLVYTVELEPDAPHRHTNRQTHSLGIEAPQQPLDSMEQPLVGRQLIQEARAHRNRGILDRRPANQMDRLRLCITVHTNDHGCTNRQTHTDTPVGTPMIMARWTHKQTDTPTHLFDQCSSRTHKQTDRQTNLLANLRSRPGGHTNRQTRRHTCWYTYGPGQVDTQTDRYADTLVGIHMIPARWTHKQTDTQTHLLAHL